MTALQDGDVAQQDIAAILEGERLVALAFLGAFGGIAQPRLVRIHAAPLRRYPALDAVPLRPRARAAQAQPVNHAGAEHRDVADPVAIDQAGVSMGAAGVNILLLIDRKSTRLNSSH